jgi:hypothetical protein
MVTGLTAGNSVTLRWTITNGSCVSFDELVLTNFEEPTIADAGTDQIGVAAICGSSTVLTANAPTIGTGLWSVVSGIGGSFANSSDPTTTFNGTPGITYTLRWTISHGVCTSSTNEVLIEFQQNPTAAPAGDDQSVCDAIVTLSANAPTIGTGVWSFISNPDNLPLSSISDVNDPSATFDGTAGVTYILAWSITNGVCPASTDQVKIGIKEFPDVLATQAGPFTLCSGEEVSIILSNPNTVAGTTFSWTVSGSNYIGAANGSGDQINQTLSSASGNTIGDVKYTITPSANGCIGASITVDVTINPNPTLTITPSAQTICTGNAINLGLSNPNNVAGTLYTWTFISSNVNGANNGGSYASPVSGPISDNLDVVLNDQGGAVTYAVTAVSPTGCVSPTQSASVTVNPEPIGVSSTANAVCSRAGYSVNPQSYISNGILNTFDWSLDPLPSGLTLTSGTTTGTGTITGTIENLSGGLLYATYSVTPTSTIGNCPGITFTISIPVESQPVGADVIGLPSLVICSGDQVGYDLQDNINDLGNVQSSVFTWSADVNNDVTGESTTSKDAVFITDILTNITGSGKLVQYTVIPKGVNGCTGESFTVGVVVRSEPVGQAVPVGSASIFCSDEQFTVNPTVSNGMTSVTYAWTANYDAGLSGGSGSGTGSIIEQLTNTTAIQKTVTYTVVPTSADGCMGESFTIAVLINPEPVGITRAVTVCSDEALSNIVGTITTTAGSVAATSYSISVSTTLLQSAGTNSNGSGKLADELVGDTWTNTTSSPVDVVYTIIPMSGASCSGNSFTITVTVNPEPVGADVLATICSDEAIGSALTLSTVSGGPTAYFNISVNSNGLTRSGGTDSNGSNKTAAELIGDSWTNTTSSPVDVIYTITPYTSTNCAGNPYTVTVTINPEPVGAVATANVCSDQVISGLNLSTSGGTPASTFNISINANGLTQSAGSVSSGTGKLLGELNGDAWTNPGTTPVDVVYTVVPVSSDGCAGNLFTVTVTVNPEPVGITRAVTVCSDEALSNVLGTITTTAGSVAATSYSISVSTTLLQSAGTNSNGSGKLADELVSDAWTNTSKVPVNVLYTITPVSGAGCSGDSFTITVTVNPEPVGVSATTTICSDEAIGALLTLQTTSGSVSAADFTISVTSNGLTQSAGTPSGGTNKTINELVGDAWTNTSGSFVYVVYTITPIPSTGCAGDNFTVIATVNPEPVGVTASTAICSDQPLSSLNLTTSGGASAASFNISINSGGLTQSAGTNSSGTGKLAGELNGDAWTNKGTTDVDVVYTITPISTAGCAGNSFIVTVSVKPEPVGISSVISVCSNEQLSAAEATILTTASSISASNFTIAVASTLSQSAGTASNGTGKSELELVGDAWANNDIIEHTVTYTITPNGTNGCIGDIFVMTTTVHPLPGLTFDFSGLPSSGSSIPEIAENADPITLVGNKAGGLFTIDPVISNIGSTIPDFVNDQDHASFDPSAVELGINHVTYSFTDEFACSSSITRDILVNPVTTVDFVVDDASVNDQGQFELCAEQPEPVRLIGFPAASTGQGPETEFTSLPLDGKTCEILQIGGEYYINTQGLASGYYRIQYRYKNDFGAITSKIHDIKVFAAPIADFISSNNCIASDVIFTDKSTIRDTPFTKGFQEWVWDMDDGTTKFIQNPTHPYAESAEYRVHLKVTTIQGCTDQTSALIRVGDIPLPDFKWFAICNNDSTRFVDESEPGNISEIVYYKWEFGDGYIIEGGTGVAIPDGSNDDNTSGVYEEPNHKYAEFGVKSVKLTVVTNDGCDAIVTKSVSILNYEDLKSTPSAEEAYFESFEGVKVSWFAEADVSRRPDATQSDTSWIWGIPNGVHITSGAKGSQKAVWTGRDKYPVDNSTYAPYENSYMNGPCFNLEGLARPMVSFDYFADTDLSDGVILQYSIDAGDHWHVVGPNPDAFDKNKPTGINWFNESSIQANPGNQTLGQFGWTGTLDRGEGQWKNARYNLDMIPLDARDQVRLRFAFASNDGNVGDGPYDGFAFDNFFVGDKQRNVVIEHFTNLHNSLAVDFNQDLDDLYTAQTLRKDQSDFFQLQYHIAVPEPDSINLGNPTDPGVRASFYNLSVAPVSIMDGIVGDYFGAELNGSLVDLKNEVIDKRALEDPLFKIDATFNPSDPSVLNFSLDFVYIDSLSDLTGPVIFQAALVETGVYSNGEMNTNVVRKMLLGPEGMTVNTTWTRGNHQEILNREVMIDVPIRNPDSLFLVAFIQDKNLNRRIHQAVIVKAPAKVGTIRVGVGDDPDLAEIQNIRIYPNPASKVLNIGLDEVLMRSYGWEIIDQRGVTVISGDLNHDLRTPQQISVKDLANGIYFMKVALSDKAVMFRKIVVLNQH